MALAPSRGRIRRSIVTTTSDPRSAVRRAKRIVVKIGSSTLARDEDAHPRLARAIRALRDEKRLVVLVSSGAIALGSRKLGYRGRPKEMARLGFTYVSVGRARVEAPALVTQ